MLLSIFSKARTARKEKIAGGQFDVETVSRLYQEQASAVYSFMLSRVRQQAEAEDLTSLVFRKAMESWHTFRPTESSAAWLFGIARHVLADHFRSRARHTNRSTEIEQEDLERVEDESIGPEEEALRQEDARVVREAILRLPPLQQEVITLKFTAQLEYKEISAMLGKNEAAIRMLVHRALENLRKELVVEQ